MRTEIFEAIFMAKKNRENVPFMLKKAQRTKRRTNERTKNVLKLLVKTY